MTRQVNLIAGEPQEFYEVSDFFRLLSAVGPLTVEFYNAGREVSEAVGISKGYAEKFDTRTFDRVRLLSPTTQEVQFVTRLGNTVQYDAAPVGDTAIVSSIALALDAATLNSLNRPEAKTGSVALNAALVANTAQTLIAPGVNVNGIVLLQAGFSAQNGASGVTAQILAKASAPASILDGDVVVPAQFWNTGSSISCNGVLMFPQYIEAGLGLYLFPQFAAASHMSSARWRAL